MTTILTRLSTNYNYIRTGCVRCFCCILERTCIMRQACRINHSIEPSYGPPLHHHHPAPFLAPPPQPWHSAPVDLLDLALQVILQAARVDFFFFFFGSPALTKCLVGLAERSVVTRGLATRCITAIVPLVSWSTAASTEVGELF
jgi:hypothetical protein